MEFLFLTNCKFYNYQAIKPLIPCNYYFYLYKCNLIIFLLLCAAGSGQQTFSAQCTCGLVLVLKSG